MSLHALLNDNPHNTASHNLAPRPCPFAGRGPEESLHDFLLRRHSEMENDLALLRAQTAIQEGALDAAHTSAERRAQWLIAAAALDVCLCLAIFLAMALAALPAGLALLGIVGLTAGNLLVFAMPTLERRFADHRAWRRT